MSFASGYRGVVGGAIQTAVTDQPGAGVPGMLAFASDFNFTDALYVIATAGVGAGRGVILTASENGFNPAFPSLGVDVPTVATANTDFAGIVVFEEAMQSDENGNPGWADGRIARIARKGRAGARIWVKAVEEVAYNEAAVHMCTVAPADASVAVGEFVTAALGGGAAGTSVDISAYARWVVGGAAGSVAMIEIL